MKMEGNTIFITGGTSGIGRGLAEALHQRGNQVIISGRREDRLQEICSLHLGMSYYRLDVTDPQAIQAVARQVTEDFPALNVVFNNSGVRMPISFAPGCPLDEPGLESEINTNLFGPIRVASAFLPHLFTKTDAMLINVSSAFAFVPRARFPVYCATKAAVHVWTLSLRHQLRDSGVHVVELIPQGNFGGRVCRADLQGPRGRRGRDRCRRRGKTGGRYLARGCEESLFCDEWLGPGASDSSSPLA